MLIKLLFVQLISYYFCYFFYRDGHYLKYMYLEYVFKYIFIFCISYLNILFESILYIAFKYFF